MAVWRTRAIQLVPSASAGAESPTSRIGLISFGMKRAGKPSAGKPHAGFDEAGAGKPAYGSASEALPEETGSNG
jgi:hypothetical protein